MTTDETCTRCDSTELDAEAVECDPWRPLCADCWQAEINSHE